MMRPPTADTVVELTDHADRHATLAAGLTGDYAVAHAAAAAGLYAAAAAHASLDALDTERGYR